MAITDNIRNLTNANSYGDVLSSLNSIGSGVGGAIKKIRSLTKEQKEPSSIKDLYTDGFLVQDSQFSPDFFARAFDEPTYLTFKVEFNFGDTESEYRNMAYNNNGLLENITDSRLDTMYDYLPEPFLEPYRKETKGRYMESLYRTDTYKDEEGNEITENSVVDASLGKTYSTESYLDFSLGEHGRAALLHNFKLALKDIQDNFPYYLTSINGINSLFKVDHASGIRLKDAKIELECMEGLDLKITQLLNMYKKIVWDDVYQRWVLPDMMRFFNMKIYISEIRLFHDFVKGDSSKQTLHDFSEKDKRNNLYSEKTKWIDKADNALRTATALSNTFLGTKSHLDMAINYVASTYETGRGLYDSIAGAITDINMCNSAFNYVMPTICIDCHMCEFDITSINAHLDSLKSSKVTDSPKPKITINVGQAKDTQIYPLNASLKYKKEKGYYDTISHYIKDSSIYNVNGMSGISNARDNTLKHTGNYISDDALKAKLTSNVIGDRLKDYDFNLQYYTGQTEAESILAKRLNRLMINNKREANYPRGYTPKELARMSLTTAGIQEVQSVLDWVDNPDDDFDMGYIIGTHSTSTSPDKSTRAVVKAVGDTLNNALDKIYNGEELQSMAVSDEMKNKIASDMFDEYIKELKNSTATSDGPMKEILKAYEVIKANSESSSDSSIDSSIDSSTNDVAFSYDYPVVKNEPEEISIATGTKFNQYN